MKISRRASVTCSVAMAAMMSHAPQVAMAEVALAEGQMLPTNIMVQEMTRQQAEEKVQGFLSQSDVRQKLMERGLSADEAASRVASLSDVELRQLSSQIEKAQYGGDILYAILIVVLIIFLIQRI